MSQDVAGNLILCNISSSEVAHSELPLRLNFVVSTSVAQVRHSRNRSMRLCSQFAARDSWNGVRLVEELSILYGVVLSLLKLPNFVVDLLLPDLFLCIPHG